MVNNEWQKTQLGAVMDFKNGLNTEKSNYGNGVKFVNVMDVFRNDVLTEDKIIGRINLDPQKIEDNLLEYGDILFNRTSETYDEIAMSAVYLDDKPATFGGFVIRGRPSKNVFDPNYSVYAFQSFDFRNQVVKLGQGAVRANIGQKDLAKVNFLIPPIQEQKKIAEILSTWDKAIETVKKLVANSQQQKKALMQQLLTGQKRLLDENGVKFKGECGKGKLSDLANISKGKALSSKNIKNGNYPVIAGGKTSPYCHNDFTHENVVTVSASGAYAGYVAYHSSKIWASDCSVITEKGNSDIKFIFQLLSYLQSTIYSLQSGGAQPHVYPKDLEIIEVGIPSKKEQKKIAQVLTLADREIDLYKEQLDKLKLEKKSLMQQLLTGQKRVKLET